MRLTDPYFAERIRRKYTSGFPEAGRHFYDYADAAMIFYRGGWFDRREGDFRGGMPGHPVLSGRELALKLMLTLRVHEQSGQRLSINWSLINQLILGQVRGISQEVLRRLETEIRRSWEKTGKRAEEKNREKAEEKKREKVEGKNQEKAEGKDWEKAEGKIRESGRQRAEKAAEERNRKDNTGKTEERIWEEIVRKAGKAGYPETEANEKPPAYADIRGELRRSAVIGPVISGSVISRSVISRSVISRTAIFNADIFRSGAPGSDHFVYNINGAELQNRRIESSVPVNPKAAEKDSAEQEVVEKVPAERKAASSEVQTITTELIRQFNMESGQGQRYMRMIPGKTGSSVLSIWANRRRLGKIEGMAEAGLRFSEHKAGREDIILWERKEKAGNPVVLSELSAAVDVIQKRTESTEEKYRYYRHDLRRDEERYERYRASLMEERRSLITQVRLLLGRREAEKLQTYYNAEDLFISDRRNWTGGIEVPNNRLSILADIGRYSGGYAQETAAVYLYRQIIARIENHGFEKGAAALRQTAAGPEAQRVGAIGSGQAAVYRLWRYMALPQRIEEKNRRPSQRLLGGTAKPRLRMKQQGYRLYGQQNRRTSILPGQEEYQNHHLYGQQERRAGILPDRTGYQIGTSYHTIGTSQTTGMSILYEHARLLTGTETFPMGLRNQVYTPEESIYPAAKAFSAALRNQVYTPEENIYPAAKAFSAALRNQVYTPEESVYPAVETFSMGPRNQVYTPEESVYHAVETSPMGLRNQEGFGTAEERWETVRKEYRLGQSRQEQELKETKRQIETISRKIELQEKLMRELKRETEKGKLTKKMDVGSLTRQVMRQMEAELRVEKMRRGLL